MSSRMLLRPVAQNFAFRSQSGGLVRLSLAQRRWMKPADAPLNVTRLTQARSYRTTLARFSEEDGKEKEAPASEAAPAAEENKGEDGSIPKFADRPDDCPEWQNPQHHNNPELQKMFSEDFAEGEEIPLQPLPPLDDKAPPHIAELAEDILHLNMLEMHELVKMVQEHFGWTNDDIDGPAMMMGGAGGGGAAGAEEVVEAVEKTAFDLRLEAFDAKSKIKVIKEVRAIAGLGLKEAKELVEGAPKVIKKDLKKEEAEELKAKLEEIGATIEIV